MPRMDCLLSAIISLVALTTAVAACPFCPPSGPTTSEQMSQADLALLVKWVRVIEPKGELAGADPQTEFRIVEAIKSPKDAGQTFQKGSTVKVNFHRDGRPGDQFLLTAQVVNGETNWNPVWEVSEVSYNYVKQAPAFDKSPSERLPYFLKFLEFGDPFIANDAFAEFSWAQYKDVAQLAPQLNREKIRGWLKDQTPEKQIRHGFFGLLLGLCGNEDDADYLAGRVLPAPADDQLRIGIDGLMAGYVLLTGERGLQKLVDAKLRVPERIDGEVSAVLNTLRFFGDVAPDRLPRSQIVAAMRLLIDDPKHGELAVVDLARWKDWDSAPQLIAAYGRPPFEKEGKKKVVQFALVAEKDLAQDSSSKVAPQIREFLEKLRRDEPSVVRAAEQVLNPPRRAIDKPARNPLEGNLDDRPAGAANGRP